MPQRAALTAGEALCNTDESLKFGLVDGDLVLYRNGYLAWQAGKTTAHRLVLQEDGNIVLRNRNNVALWASRTQGDTGLLLIAEDRAIVLRDLEGCQLWFVGETPEPCVFGSSIVMGDSWHYYADDIAPSYTWLSPLYDDSMWPVGRGQFGFGDGDETTQIPRTSSKSVYFRKTIQITEDFDAATLRVIHDDGVAVFINGDLVMSANIRPGDEFVHEAGAAQRSVDNQLTTKALPMGVLRRGENVVAVVVKQYEGLSSDLSFDLALTYNRIPHRPYLFYLGSTRVYDPNGQNLLINRPHQSRAGDLLVLVLHRTDDVLPLVVPGWERAAECYKQDNGFDCATATDCDTWFSDGRFCRSFGDKGGGRDLAQVVLYRFVAYNEPWSYEFDLNRDTSGHPGWAILAAIRGADLSNPIRDWSHRGCDRTTASEFPSVYGETGDLVLLSQSFDDPASADAFLAPIGTELLGYVTGERDYVSAYDHNTPLHNDETGFLFGGTLDRTGHTGPMRTEGPGGPKCKDALVSLTIRPQD